MFFKDRKSTTNITGATPERVYALCKNIEKSKGNAASVKSMQQEMEPDFINKTMYFSTIKDVAIDLGLITEMDGFLSLIVNKDTIKTIDHMRIYINNHMDELSNGMFYAITNAYFSLNTDLFSKVSSLSAAASMFEDMIGSEVSQPSMRAWRFWASFLGFGYLDDMLLLPNASKFLSDLIVKSTIEKKEIYDAEEFFTKLQPNLNIIVDTNDSKRLLNYGTTVGFKTLEKIQHLKIEKILDHDTWNFCPIKSETTVFTNIEILK